jgi:hypothetical protein
LKKNPAGLAAAPAVSPESLKLELLYDAARRNAKADLDVMDNLPEPYRSAARLLPGDDWRFVLLAYLSHGGPNNQLTPARRRAFRDGVRRELKRLFPKGKKGRPREIDLSSPVLRRRLWEDVKQRRLEIRAARQKGVRGSMSPREQAIKEIAKRHGIGDVRALEKAISPEPQAFVITTPDLLEEVYRPGLSKRAR